MVPGILLRFETTSQLINELISEVESKFAEGGRIDSVNIIGFFPSQDSDRKKTKIQTAARKVNVQQRR